MLHPVELLLIQKALTANEEDSGATKNKCVLFDIFARSSDGIIEKEGKKLKTHTVVLFKQKDKIILIDPSNSEFSQHITLGLNKVLLGEHNIAAYDKKLQIYTPNGETGTEPNQYRDCTDIAVKIALGFNHLCSINSGESTDLDEVMSSDINKVMFLKIIREITKI